MSSVKRPPVEPLSRPAWERVEAAVFERLDRGEHLLPMEGSPRAATSRRSWAVASVFAAAAALALWWRVGMVGEVGEPAPSATVLQPVASAPVRRETHIASTESRTETKLGDAAIVLAPHSALSVSGDDSEGWLVRLESGSVDCAVAPRQGRPPFVVRAGETEVTVVGTRFAVARTADGTRVSVTEGHVKVDAGSAHVLLGPGESWPAAAEPAPEAPAVASEAPPEAEPRVAPSSAAARAQRRFERAARLESKHPAQALAIYRQLARNGGPWAANGLYAGARLEVELGHPGRAEPLLREYLQRYPDGLNAPDVRKLLERVRGGEP